MLVTIVTPYALPERGANILRVHSLQHFLEKKGHQVEILAPQRTCGSHPDVTRYPGIFALMRLVVRSKSEAVIFTSPPLTHGLFSGIAALLSGKRFYLDLRDPWPLAFEKIGLYSKETFKVKAYKLLERFTYLLARKIFVVTDGIGAHVSSKGFHKKVVLAPNGTTGDFKFYSSRRKSIRKSLGVRGSEVLLIYSGAFVGWEVDKVINAIKKMPSNYKLLLLIPDNKEQHNEYVLMKKLAESTLSKRVVVIDMASFEPEKVSDYFSAADVGISTIPEGLNYCIRAKVYDYVAAGLFSLAEGPSKGSLCNLFKEFYLGKYYVGWKKFSEFKTDKASLSFQQRMNRIEIAKKHFMRDRTNQIIMKGIES